MTVINTSDIKIGQTISFRTVNPFDNVKRVGQVTGICDYNIARLFLDVDTYHRQVLHISPDIGSAKDLKYFIISYKENSEDDDVRRIAIADVWMSPGSVEIVDENPYIDFRVYNISTAKAGDIINLIKSAGYDVTVKQ